MSKYHKILGVSPGASQIQIKKAYFKKAKTLHPDVNPSKNAIQEFVRIKQAYEILTNPKYRTKPIVKPRKKTKEQFHREWEERRKRETYEQARKAALKKRKKFSEYSASASYSSITNLGHLIISLVIFFPICISCYNIALNSTDPTARNSSVLLGAIFFILAMILLWTSANHFIKKFFK